MEYQMKDILDELKSIVQKKSSNIWMDIGDAVDYTKLSESTIRRAVAKGELKVSKTTGKLLFQIKWIDKWLVGQVVMPRGLKNNVEFFYHRCAPNKVVRLIKRKFGVIGYAFYYQLRELLGDAKHHNYVLKNELDWQDFLTIMEMDEDKANEIIEFLIKVEELDKNLWENEKRLYSQNFVDRLAPVYAKRKSEMPDKYSFRDGNVIYSTETPVSGSEIPKERQTYTQTKRKTISKRTKFLAKCNKCDFYKYVESIDTYFVCRENNDHGRMPVTTL